MRALVQTAMTFGRSWIRNRRGATAVEYGFLLALIVLAIMAALVQLGSTTSELWSNVSTKVQSTH